jgi:Flp pilus assembly protein TadD
MKKRTGRSEKMADSLIFPGILLFILAFGIYANTLGHEFVFDDSTLILQNPQVIELDLWGMISGEGYRPVRGITYLFNYYTGGEDPFGYHLFNVLLHCFNVVLVLVFIHRWIGSVRVSILSALIFCVHPVQTAAVAYISGRKDLLAVFFLLIGFILFLEARKKASVWRLIFSFAAFVLAVASKEVAIVFPVLLVLVDAIYRRKSNPDGETQNLFAAIANSVSQAKVQYLLFAGIGLFALASALFILPASRMEGYWGGSFAANLGTSFKLFIHYLKMSVFPFPLIADYSGEVFPISTGFLEPATLLAVLLTVGFIAFTCWLALVSPDSSVGLIWFSVTLLPVLQLVPFHELAADHFLYLPILGFGITFGYWLDRLTSTFSKKNPVWAAVAVLVFFSSWVVVQRNRVWENPKTLWETTLNQAPGSYRANANLAQILMREGQAQESIRLMKRSIEIDPNQSVSWTNLGFVYYQIGRQKRLTGDSSGAEENLNIALEHFEKAAELSPSDAVLQLNLGAVYSELYRVHAANGDSSQAEKYLKTAENAYRRVIRRSRRDRRQELDFVRRNFAGLYLDSGRPRLAIRQLESYVIDQPNDPVAYYLMGEAYFRINKFQDAEVQLKKSIELGATAAAWESLAKLFENSDRVEEAIEALGKAAELSPDSPELRLKLGILYRKRGEVYFAVQEFQKASRLDSSGRYGPLIAREIREMTGNRK